MVSKCYKRSIWICAYIPEKRLPFSVGFKSRKMYDWSLATIAALEQKKKVGIAKGELRDETFLMVLSFSDKRVIYIYSFLNEVIL
jgi:hypothetical protein